jgi:two-component system alkaline phosphatase synthesis response regulator PhoP
MKKRILIVEDEPGLVMALTDCLTSENYAVECAHDGDTGLSRALSEPFDLVLLDLMLPGRGGFDVLKELRQRGVRTPVIMLTARGETIDKVVGLTIGADDYITKPFETPELLARIQAVLRRVPLVPGQTVTSYSFGDITVDFRSTQAFRNGQELEMAAREFRLLKFLIEHRGVTVSREELLNEVWGYDAMPSTRTVDVHIAQLRQKIESNPHDPQFLRTIYGFGYGHKKKT